MENFCSFFNDFYYVETFGEETETRQTKVPRDPVVSSHLVASLATHTLERDYRSVFKLQSRT